jgi:hypothetical protein
MDDLPGFGCVFSTTSFEDMDSTKTSWDVSMKIAHEETDKYDFEEERVNNEKVSSLIGEHKNVIGYMGAVSNTLKKIHIRLAEKDDKAQRFNSMFFLNIYFFDLLFNLFI